MAPHTIAVAGKGGVGKTTTCGMIIDYLTAKGRGPVLVVDADANSNLNEVLGVEVETSLGAIREEMAQAELKGTIPKGMTKADYAEFKFNSALIEDFYRNEVQPKPGVIHFLYSLKTAGIRMCIATATDRYQIEAALRRCDMQDFFEEIKEDDIPTLQEEIVTEVEENNPTFEEELLHDLEQRENELHQEEVPSNVEKVIFDDEEEINEEENQVNTGSSTQRSYNVDKEAKVIIKLPLKVKLILILVLIGVIFCGLLILTVLI